MKKIPNLDIIKKAKEHFIKKGNFMSAKQFEREELLIGKENLEKLKKSKIVIYGIGGVGSFCTEALARAGIGNFTLVDYDTVDITNINRQIHALNSTVEKYKVQVMKDRILDINKEANVEIIFDKEKRQNEENLIDNSFDYVIDAVDTITTKIKLIEKAKNLNVSIISSMGTGNKLDPTKFKVADIYKTSVCPLSKIMRKELKRRNIKDLKVVYSEEIPKKIEYKLEEKNKTIGSISFVPSVAGLIMAGEVIKDLILKP